MLQFSTLRFASGDFDHGCTLWTLLRPFVKMGTRMPTALVMARVAPRKLLV
jgi:hypothetical protein